MLTPTRIKNAKPKPKYYMVVDRDGLYLRVRRSGSKSFVFRKKRNGHPSINTLGRAGDEYIDLNINESPGRPMSQAM